MKIMNDGWQKADEELKKLSLENLAFLNSSIIKRTIITPLSANTAMCEKEILAPLMKYHKNLDGCSILEVGAGYGNFCRIFHKVITPSKYTILDIDGMLRCSKAFLKHHNVPCEFIPVHHYKQLNARFDLVVSTICLAETPSEYKKDLIRKVFVNCNRCLVTNHQDDKETEKGLEEIYPSLLKIPGIISTVGSQKNQTIYIGSKE